MGWNPRLKLSSDERRARGVRWLVVMALGASVAAGCARYQFGNRSLYSCDISTVYVPMVESDSYRRYLGERLTEAVVKEITLKTPYQIVHDPTLADSVLACRIRSESKRTLIEDPYDSPRQQELNLEVDVRWLDRQGAAMRNQPVPVDPTLVQVGQAATLTPEIGQSIATAQQQAIDRLAEQIVALMESPW